MGVGAGISFKSYFVVLCDRLPGGIYTQAQKTKGNTAKATGQSTKPEAQKSKGSKAKVTAQSPKPEGQRQQATGNKPKATKKKAQKGPKRPKNAFRGVSFSLGCFQQIDEKKVDD